MSTWLFCLLGLAAILGTDTSAQAEHPTFTVLVFKPTDGAIVSGPKFDATIKLLETSGNVAQPPGSLLVCINLRPFPSDDSEVLDPYKLPPEALLSKPDASCFNFDIDLSSPQREWETGVELSVAVSGWYRLEVSLEERGDFGGRALHAFAAADLFVTAPRPGWPQPACFASPLEGEENSCTFMDIDMMLELQSSANEPRYVGLYVTVGGECGWGVAGLHLALGLLRRGLVPVPLLEAAARPGSLTAAQRTLLAPAFEAAAPLHLPLPPPPPPPGSTAAGWREDGTGGVRPLPFPVLHAMGLWGPNRSVETTAFRFSSPPSRPTYWSATRNIGLLFSEETDLSPEDARRLNAFDRVFAGSRWNLAVLVRGGLAEHRGGVFPQGVDTDLFKSPLQIQQADIPSMYRIPDTEKFFDIFSGGKLELRKGQDIVLAAFARFARSHPDARLVVAWDNKWNDTVATVLESPHTRGMPAMREGGILDLAPWLAANGVPPGRVIDLGSVPHPLMPAVFSQVDVALFPNRCEGGTNLVAMEAVAAGVPAVLSANTGHLDLIARVGAPNVLLLRDDEGEEEEEEGGAEEGPGGRRKAQGGGGGAAGAAAARAAAGRWGWGEPSPAAAAARLAAVRRDPAAARRRAGNAASWVAAGWGWPGSVGALLEDAGLLPPPPLPPRRRGEGGAEE